MYKALINLFYLLLIKSNKFHYGYSILDVDAAANKIVMFNVHGSFK